MVQKTLNSFYSHPKLLNNNHFFLEILKNNHCNNVIKFLNKILYYKH